MNSGFRASLQAMQREYMLLVFVQYGMKLFPKEKLMKITCSISIPTIPAQWKPITESPRSTSRFCSTPASCMTV